MDDGIYISLETAFLHTDYLIVYSSFKALLSWVTDNVEWLSFPLYILLLLWYKQNEIEEEKWRKDKKNHSQIILPI